MMTNKQIDKGFYQALKVETKKRKIKLSAEQDIYKKYDSYFFTTFYYISNYKDGKLHITISTSVKYHRFDELQYGILFPNEEFRFTDKLRANSGVMCTSEIEHMIKKFDFDGNEESLPVLATALLDYLEVYYKDFLDRTEKEYGSLSGYFIANKHNNPRLAGLAYLDNGNIEEAVECFLNPNMDGDSNVWSSIPQTDEQLKRAFANGFKEGFKYCDRSTKDIYVDYATVIRKGLEWTKDKACFGLLPEEKEKQC
jgi:hypothetical protein